MCLVVLVLCPPRNLVVAMCLILGGAHWTIFNLIFLMMVLQLYSIQGQNIFGTSGPFNPLLRWSRDLFVFFPLVLALSSSFVVVGVYPAEFKLDS